MKKFLKISKNLFIEMGKAQTHKYVKRIPKASGKGYIYFYKDKKDKIEKKEKEDKLKNEKIDKDKDYNIIYPSEINKKSIKEIEKIESLGKAKKMPIGTVSKGKKKVAEGKWVPVKEEKKEKESEKEKPKEEEKEKSLTDNNRNMIKNALKKMASILAEALSGKDPNQPTGAAVEQAGEDIHAKGRIKQKPKELEKQNDKNRNKK